MSRPWWKENGAVLVILALYLALATAYGLIVPAYEAPDEPGHLAYVWHLLQHHRFPVQQPAYEANLSAEGHQPPLYYLLGAATILPLADDTRDFRPPTANTCFAWQSHDPGWQAAFQHTEAEAFPFRGLWLGLHLLRELSVLLGGVTVWATYRLGRLLFPDRRWLAPAAAATVAFNPQFLFIQASINNDNLATALSALLLLVSVRAVTQPARRRDFALMGLLLGLGALTKYSTFALAPLPFLALLWQWRQERDGREALRHLALLVGLPVAIAGWWYVRNQLLYGDPLAWQIMLDTLGRYVARSGPFTAADLRAFVVTSFTSFWAYFGWLSLKLPSLLYVALAVVCGLGLIGALLDLRQRRRQYSPGLWLVITALLGVGASMVRYVQTINASGYQGRLFFPAIPSLAILLVLGLSRLIETRRVRLVLSGLSASLCLLSVAALLGLIRPAYASPDLYAPATLPAMAEPCLRFGDQLELAAYDIHPSRVHPHETLHLTLYWHALSDSPPWPAMTVKLLGRHYLSLQKDTGFPLSWQHGDMFITRHSTGIPYWLPPSRARLSIQWRSFGEPLPAATARGRSLGETAELEGIIIGPSRAAAMPQHPAEASFGGFVALRGYDLSRTEADPGDLLSLTLHWQALAPADADYTVLVHLMDATGQPVSQADGQPFYGDYPTTLWATGDPIADERLIPLSDELPAGDYTLGVGWYLLATGERLPAIDASGTRLPNDVAILQAVRVTQAGGQ
ncbi:MAG: DUF2142 domain-containing protein [Chloroflexota bacterium]